MIRHSIGSTIAALLYFFCAERAVAFSYEEHKTISTIAYAIARERLMNVPEASTLQPLDLEVLAAFLTGLPKSLDRGSRPSYGDLVAKVDFLLDERRYFGADGVACGNGWGGLDLEAIEDVSNHRIDYFVAAARDDAHFREGAVRAANLWHRSARGEARSGSLACALAASAVASHFLQDIFAPGHVFAEKGNWPDVAVLSTHNFRNHGTPASFLAPASFTDLIDVDASPTLRALIQGSRRSLPEWISRWQDPVHRVRLTGDFRLSGGIAAGDPDAVEQQLFVILVTEERIWQVLETYIHNECSADIRLAWSKRDLDLGIVHYHADSRSLNLLKSLVQSPVAVTLASRSSVGSSDAPTGWGVEVELESFASFLGFSAGLFGLSANYNLRNWSFGLSQRLVRPLWSRLDLQASAEFAFRWQDDRSGRYSRAAYALRLEKGFGLLFLGVGASWERRQTATSPSRPPGVVVTSTFTMYDVAALFRPNR